MPNTPTPSLLRHIREKGLKNCYRGDFIEYWINLVFLGLQIWLGIRGNEMTAKNYLELGWNFTNPDSDEVKFAKGKWGINIWKKY